MPNREKRRAEVNQDLGGPQALRPQAGAESLRDSFSYVGQTQYGAPQMEGLFSLARSLGAIEPRLNQAVNNLIQAKTIRTEMQQREASMLAEELAFKNQGDFRQLIKNNPGMAGANPWLPVYVEKASARYTANQFDQHVRTVYGTSNLRLNSDPAAFDQFYNEELQKFMSERGLSFGTRAMVQDLIPRIEQSKQALRNYHIQQQMKANIEAAEAALGQQAQTLVENAYDRILSNSKGLNLDGIEELASTLTEMGSEAVQFGLSGPEGHRVNTALASAVIRVAEERGDEDLLKVLDHIKTGTGTLGNIPDISKASINARRNIRNENWTQEQRALAEYERRKKEVNEAVYAKTVEALIQNPDADISTNIKTLLTLNMGKEAEQLMDLQSKLQKRGIEIMEDPRLAATLIGQAYVASSPEESLEVLRTAIEEMSKSNPRISAKTVSSVAAIHSSISQRQENKTGRTINTDFKDAIERDILNKTKPDELSVLAKDRSAEALRDFYSRLEPAIRQRRDELGRPLTPAETEQLWEKTADEVIEKYNRMRQRTRSSQPSKSQSQSQPRPVTQTRPQSQTKPQQKSQPQPQPSPTSNLEKKRQEVRQKLMELEKLVK